MAKPKGKNRCPICHKSFSSVLLMQWHVAKKHKQPLPK